MKEHSEQTDPALPDEALENFEPLTLPNPLQLVSSEFKHVAIVGLGLIGGSIGLRMKAMGFNGTIIGCDRREVLDEALARGVIDIGFDSPVDAVENANLVVLAVPFEQASRLLPEVMAACKPKTVVTDTCPVKSDLLRMAAGVTGSAHFVGGHPLAGSDRKGIANADPNLFESAYWLVVPCQETPPEIRESVIWWVRMLGAYPLTLSADRHDQIVAMTTHAPLVVTMALSSWIAAHSADEPLLVKLATGRFRDVTSLCALPKEAWAEVLQANKPAVLSALIEYRNVLDDCIERLRGEGLGEVWRDVHDLQKKISRERPGDWDANAELIITTADRPGSIAKIASLLAMNDINIRDIGVLYVREQRGGSLRVILESLADARRAVELLRHHGFSARQKL